MGSKPRIAVALAALSLAVVAACGGGDDVVGRQARGGRPERLGRHRRDDHDVDACRDADASERLVKAYNASHKNQVKLTVIPTDNYQARVAAAAGGNNLPDLFASDVIYAPNYTSQGLYLDITDRINELPFEDRLAPAHMRLGTFEGKQYTVPHTLDLSVLFWNKALYKKAGLDPETPPKTMKEFAEHATTIRKKIGGDTYGTFFGGNCPGCYVFTFWPSVWAGGGNVMNEDGTRARSTTRRWRRRSRSTTSSSRTASSRRPPRTRRGRRGPASSPRARSASCRCRRPRSASCRRTWTSASRRSRGPTAASRRSSAAT